MNSGDFITIIGGNGAGKSTLLNSIAGTIPTEQGKIVLGDKEITRHSVTRRSKEISRVFQDPRMGTAVRLTVEENLALAYKKRPGSRVFLRCQRKASGLLQRKVSSLESWS